MLVVDVDPALDLKPLPGGSMHFHDFGLFYADIRADAVRRARRSGAAAKPVRRLFRTLLAFVVLAVLGSGSVGARGAQRLAEARRGRYARALWPARLAVTSRLAEQQLHYVDEGSGPAIVLVHGSYASLRKWQAWAGVLKAKYRVIRFDRPGMGLSGPSPDARYDGEAEAALIGQLADHLKLDRFMLRRHIEQRRRRRPISPRSNPSGCKA